MQRSTRTAAPAGFLALSLAVAALGASGLASSARAANPTVTVRAGDTLSGIALRHHTTVASLVALNHLADPDRIFVGQRLVLSSTGSTSTTSQPSSAAKSSGGPAVHVVRAGEHLTGIAREFGTTIAALVRANGIDDPNRIFAGQRLVIPRSTGTAAGSSSSFVSAFAAFPPDVARRMGERTSVRDLIAAEARRAGVPVTLALGLAWQESGWQQAVRSSANAIGVMQLTPATGDWVAMTMLGAPVNLHDVRQNVRAGVVLLHHYLVRYHGNRTLALAAYYQGQRAVDLHGVYAETRPYVAAILAVADRLR